VTDVLLSSDANSSDANSSDANSSNANAPDPRRTLLGWWRQHPVAQICVFVGISSAILLALSLPLLLVFWLTRVQLDPFSERGGLTTYFCLAVAAGLRRRDPAD